MTAKESLEKVQAMRKELEEESHLLIEEQQILEKDVQVLEEQVASQELKIEQALVEDLRSRNKATKSSITRLEARKKELETKLGQMEQEASASSVQVEADAEENGATITIVESEDLVDAEEEKSRKKRRRLF